MSKTRITINGKKVFADAGQTILEVVHQQQIDHIPNLCLENQLEPYNSCFLCLVEVKGVNKLVPACSTVIREDMEIVTRNAAIDAGRRASLELLLSNHYADCLPPCAMTCPAGVDVQGYVAHIANGDYQEAVKVIKETNPLPAVCGRVCTRPCEVACRRNLLDSNVKIDFLKRYASDFDMQEAMLHVKPEIAPDKDLSIAIIGAGPAGLSAAYYLRKAGYQVTIFEGMPEPGGMLRYGIPEYRLPYDVLDGEINTIIEMGVTLKTNYMLGEDMGIKDLFDVGFDAVFLGIGAWGSRSLGVKGQDAEGILSGIKFLEELGRGKKPELKGRVVVVGGGNTAVDCARTSLRLNADKVVLLYRRTRKEMPANEIEIDAAEHEGVEMHFLAAPVEVITKNNRVTALKCIQMELGAPDASGRRRPVPIAGSEFIVECEYVFAAIGQNPMSDSFKMDDPEFLPENGKLNFTRWESVIVNPDTLETDTDAVFAGGDMVTGAATVIEAIAAGRKAAFAIDKLFTEGVSQGEPVHFNSRKDDFATVDSTDLRFDKKLNAHEMPELNAGERIKSFDEVELGYCENEALEESVRCLECGCDEVFVCKLREYATEYNVKVNDYKGEYGKYEIDRSHPFIELDQNKCVLCGRCIRVCSQIVGESVYGFNTRGFSTSVTPEMGKQLAETSCVSCGQCIATCPTGAISARVDWDKPGPWNLSETLTTCGYCGVGCSQTLNSLTDKVVKATAGDEASATHGNLCRKGRFGTGYIHDPQRFLVPKIDDQEISWSEAIQSWAKMVRLINEKYTGDEIAVCLSPRMTNEEAYLFQKFARVMLKTHNVFSISREINPDFCHCNVFSTASFKDIESADLVLISGADLAENHRVADFMVRKSQQAGGYRIVIASEETKCAREADLFLNVAQGTEAIAVQGLMKMIVASTDIDVVDEPFKTGLKKLAMRDILKATGLKKGQMEVAVDMLMAAKSPVVISEKDLVGTRDVNDIRHLQDLAIIIEGRFAAFSRFNNTQGLVDMGGCTCQFGGYQKLTDEDAMDTFQKAWSTDLKEIPAPAESFLKGLKAKQWKAVVIIGEEIPDKAIPRVKDATELLKHVEYLVVADLFETRTMKHADLKIPMSTAAETNGSFTNSLRNVNFVWKAIESQTGVENWEIIVGLAREMNIRHKFEFSSIEDVQDEIETLIPIYSETNFGETSWKLDNLEGIDIDLFNPQRLNLTIPKTKVKPVESTNAIWNWFGDFWKKNGLN